MHMHTCERARTRTRDETCEPHMQRQAAQPEARAFAHLSRAGKKGRHAAKHSSEHMSVPNSTTATLTMMGSVCMHFASISASPSHA